MPRQAIRSQHLLSVEKNGNYNSTARLHTHIGNWRSPIPLASLSPVFNATYAHGMVVVRLLQKPVGVIFSKKTWE